METKPTILICDDEAGPRESLKMILKPFYNVIMVENGEKALNRLKETSVDLMTLDLKMPGMHGTDVLRAAKTIRPDLEVIIITGFGTLKTAVDGIRLGAADYLLKPFNVSEIIAIINKILEKKKLYQQLREFLADLGNIVGMDRDIAEVREAIRSQVNLFDKVKELLNQAVQGDIQHRDENYLEFIKTLAETFERQDPYMVGHARRTHYLANLIAQKLALSPEDQYDLQVAAYLHDIGKVGIDNKIIFKDGTFTRNEMEIARKHSEIGEDLLRPIGISARALSVVRHHHERFDGSGYPDGLKADEIPLLARIVCAADAIDSMLSERPHRKAMPIQEVMAELIRCAGTQFDTGLVKIIEKIVEDDRDALTPPSLGRTTIAA